jgi:hypothetical protein
MLLSLAKRISDQVLPKVFTDSTFTIANGCPQRSLEDEEDLVMAFDYKVQDALDEERRNAERNSDEDSDLDSDLDPERDSDWDVN